MITLLINCSGCNATTTGRLHRDFRSLFGAGREYGFGRWVLRAEAPEDWTLFDPFTNTTYCPVCSDEIWGPTVNQDANDGRNEAPLMVSV